MYTSVVILIYVYICLTHMYVHTRAVYRYTRTGSCTGACVREYCKVLICLTRFNKICHPSQRPRWQVDKEAIGLSRVQQCYDIIRHQ